MTTLFWIITLFTMLLALALLIVVLLQGSRLNRLERRLALLLRQRAEAAEAAPAASAKPAPQANPLLAPDDTTRPQAPEPPLTKAATQAGSEGPPEANPPLPEDLGLGTAVARDTPGQAQAAATQGPAPAPQSVPDAPNPVLKWVEANWVYAISALSLALAGIFLLQYGVENGYLSPPVRVIAALVFGAGLVAWGERIRRRAGHGATDGQGQATAFLPAVFSGAGIVTLFAAVLAAQVLYGLTGPGTTFAGLVLVSGGALVLGWFSGPTLTAIGLTGATAAPFLVGGDGAEPRIFFVYFGLIGLLGLGIDTFRRWAWVSVLALVLSGLGGALLALAADALPSLWIMLTVLVLGAMAIPVRRLWPDHTGPDFIAFFAQGGKPHFPTWLALGALAVACLVIGVGPHQTQAEVLLASVLLALLYAAVAAWGYGAPALSALVVLPAGAFLCLIAWVAGQAHPVAPEQANQTYTTTITLLGGGLSALAGWRSLRGEALLFWALLAALTGPLAVLLLEVFWLQGAGGYTWALHALGMAALMTVLAERFARTENQAARRAAYATLAALSLIALAMFAVLSAAALTVALAVLVAVAAWLDRRFTLPEMQWFIVLGVLTLGFRLLVNPGLGIFVTVALIEKILSFGAALAGMGAALWLLKGRDRRTAQVFLESGLFTYAGIFACVLLFHWLDRLAGAAGEDTHWAFGLYGTIWALCALAQLYRLQLESRLRIVRLVLMWAFAGLSGLMLITAMTLFSPLVGSSFFSSGIILGPQPFDTTALAYLLPAVPVLVAAAWMRGWPRLLPLIFGLGLVAYWIFVQVRVFWHGVPGLEKGFLQPELYTYTVILLSLGAALLYQAIARRSVVLRRIALGVIGLTVAKVFFVDASGLSGLLRVFSFLALGLALAGLAWLDRWAAGQGTGGDAPDAPDAPDALTPETSDTASKPAEL